MWQLKDDGLFSDVYGDLPRNENKKKMKNNEEQEL